jgi:hypothetical protein
MCTTWMRRLLCAAAIGAVATLAAAAELPGIVQLEADKIPQIKAPKEVPHGQTPLRVKVLVYEFNPWIPGSVHAPDQADATPKRLNEVCGWNDSVKLAAGYMQDMCDASGGYVQYEIVEWNVVDSFQRKRDGFSYTPESYMAAKQSGQWHQPDGVDYAHEIKLHRIHERIDAGEADEVWWFGLPYFGYWESVMIGPASFWINAPPQKDFECKRRFAIMGWNSERGVAEMIHNMGHRTESTMSRVYGGWKVEQLTSNWARFAANEHQSGKGTAAVGTCHYPANAESDYDYSNTRTVMSTADDWLNYPKLTGEQKPVSRENWAAPHKNRNGAPDYHRNYQVWFFTRLPKAPGINEDGRLNNWWEYIYNFNAYDAQGKRLPGAKPIVDDEAAKKLGAVRPS